jgi:hypothetical protein
MNAPQKPINPPPARSPVPAASPWRRWQRDLGRIGGLIGFRAFGIGTIMLLLAALWLDSSQAKRAAEQRSQRSSAAEVAKMRALLALKSRIEDGLRESLPAYAQAQQQVLVAADPAQAQDIWKAEWSTTLQTAQVGDVTLTPTPAGKAAPNGIVGMEVSFSAVPGQLLDIVDKVDHGNRLQRVASLDLTVADDAAQPHLLVHMALEARYAPPEGKNKPKPGGMPQPRPAKPLNGGKS